MELLTSVIQTRFYFPISFDKYSTSIFAAFFFGLPFFYFPFSFERRPRPIPIDTTSHLLTKFISILKGFRWKRKTIAKRNENVKRCIFLFSGLKFRFPFINFCRFYFVIKAKLYFRLNAIPRVFQTGAIN